MTLTSFLQKIPQLGSRQYARIGAAMVMVFIFLSSFFYFDLPLPTRVGSVKDQSAKDSSSSSGPSVEFVVASLKGDDSSWLQEYISKWKTNLYVVNDQSAPLTVPQNKGREAMVYLTHIINNYDNLPDILIFIHSLRYQWHNDDPLYDGVPLMQSLRTQHIIEQGYANLRCVWTLGCPDEIHPLQENHRPSNDQAGHTQEAYAEAFNQLFPGQNVPETIGVGCCAQFAASRTTIHTRPKSDYEHYREWLLTTTLEDSISGRVMEYSWHQIFGKPPVHCPDASWCYCQTYGLCNLTCTENRCGDRWHFPPSASMPKGWPEYGWQGELRTKEQLEEMRLESMPHTDGADTGGVAAG
ncbi:hypothetical protein PV10_00325 [Exophiala mesophila]|uniref:DUF3431 domain containing protein n=1 Tax=Exophiala mesophila TaxID=212818 RepID=A0A0D1X3Q9_EXOME|nr:uncharacterized protein PV10_00325 [Exophiala mesophila]KIV96455.1 hypothetical protein PV10_00325 [Exophiala mesophila]